jgi:hypothetical protein
MQHNLGLFAHNPQNLATGQGRPDAISIGPGMRSDHETMSRPNFL